MRARSRVSDSLPAIGVANSGHLTRKLNAGRQARCTVSLEAHVCTPRHFEKEIATRFTPIRTRWSVTSAPAAEQRPQCPTAAAMGFARGWKCGVRARQDRRTNSASLAVGPIVGKCRHLQLEGRAAFTVPVARANPSQGGGAKLPASDSPR